MTHSVIFGRAIKTEYLTLGTLFATAATAYSAMGGKNTSAANKTIAERVSEAVPINAASKYVFPCLTSMHMLIGDVFSTFNREEEEL